MTPLLMGILNVTPDSFSDAGLHFDAEASIAAGLRMIEEGADVIDVGGESTRPGAAPVSVEEELRRVMPAVSRLTSGGHRVSIDTSKASVAKPALASGAWMVNDVTAFADHEMAAVCAHAGCQVCLMHMQGTPQTMQANPTYGDVVAEVKAFLLGRAEFAEAAGVPRHNIWIDPGFGFGKTLEHNLTLLNHLEEFVETGYKVLIGVSRKSFLGRIANPSGVSLPIEERLPATLLAQTIAQMKGVACIRAHDVRESRQGIDVTAEILSQ